LAFVSSGVVPNHATKFYFVGIDKARFRKPVEPGDQLVLTAQVERALKGIWRFSTSALVGETEVAHAEMMVAPETGK
jgi:3-hydroxyacyl-[acyl-carrier-protein] dehydratase